MSGGGSRLSHMLKQRIITAFVLLFLVLFLLFLAPGEAWPVFTAVIGLFVLHEMARMAKFGTFLHLALLVLGGLLAYYIFYGGARGLIAGSGNIFPWLVLAFWLVFVPLSLAGKWRIRNHIAVMILGLVMVGPFMHYFNLIKNSMPPLQFLTLFGFIWIADIGAYAFGKMWGRRKLAPSISPGKTWEGALGGVLMSWLYVILMLKIGWMPATREGIWMLLLLSFVFVAISIMGDLYESWFKRVCQVKDSGWALPGHGGVWDRTDSLLAVASVYGAGLAFWPKIAAILPF